MRGADARWQNGFQSPLDHAEGWRVALPTETPTWENLLYDETLPGANLRGGALVVIQVNPTTNITAATVRPLSKMVAPNQTKMRRCSLART